MSFGGHGGMAPPGVTSERLRIGQMKLPDRARANLIAIRKLEGTRPHNHLYADALEVYAEFLELKAQGAVFVRLEGDTIEWKAQS